MPNRRFLSVLAVAALLGAAGCGSQDAPVADADPAGMGAGRPDTTAGEEVPAAEVLDGMDVSPTGTLQDTSDTAQGGAPGPGQGAPR